jgi:hypothetical protein
MSAVKNSILGIASAAVLSGCLCPGYLYYEDAWVWDEEYACCEHPAATLVVEVIWEPLGPCCYEGDEAYYSTLFVTAHGNYLVDEGDFSGSCEHYGSYYYADDTRVDTVECLDAEFGSYEVQLENSSGVDRTAHVSVYFAEEWGGLERDMLVEADTTRVIPIDL